MWPCLQIRPEADPVDREFRLQDPFRSQLQDPFRSPVDDMLPRALEDGDYADAGRGCDEIGMPDLVGLPSRGREHTEQSFRTADQQPAGMIQVKGRHSRSSTWRRPDERIPFPAEVLGPAIGAGMEERDDRPRFRVVSFDPVRFPQVAARARPGQVIDRGGSITPLGTMCSTWNVPPWSAWCMRQYSQRPSARAST